MNSLVLPGGIQRDVAREVVCRQGEATEEIYLRIHVTILFALMTGSATPWYWRVTASVGTNILTSCSARMAIWAEGVRRQFPRGRGVGPVIGRAPCNYLQNIVMLQRWSGKRVRDRLLLIEREYI